MIDYEILIFNRPERPSVVFSTSYLSDAAAMRAATDIADGRAVELWRDGSCLMRWRPPAHGANNKAA
jgi:hypothetical protein